MMLFVVMETPHNSSTWRASLSLWSVCASWALGSILS